MTLDGTFTYFATYFLFSCGLCWGMDNISYRKKRVVYGNEHLEPSEYRSTKYFVWIGNSHECDIPLPDALLESLDLPLNYELSVPDVGVVCSPSSHHLRCTGSLLMPKVVQTACHCVVDYVAVSDYESRPVKFNVNEKRFRIYPGKSLVSYMKKGVLAQRYLYHPKCWTSRQSVLYDYGLIVLEDSMEPYQKTYAPVYHVDDLANIWTELMRKRKICLVIGFGAYRAKIGPLVTYKSPVLLHCWERTMDYMLCYYNTVHKVGGDHDYREEATWFCNTQMPANRTPEYLCNGAGKGDSGGPVTCDNEYLGVVSHSIGAMDLPAPIAFTPLENSVTYRRQLKKYLEDTEDIMYTTRDPIGYYYMVTDKPIRYKKKKKRDPTSIAIHLDEKTLPTAAIVLHMIVVLIKIISHRYLLL